jgi:hypothetical protein
MKTLRIIFCAIAIVICTRVNVSAQPTAFSVTSPTNGTIVTGTTSITGTVGSQWLDVAAYDKNNGMNKVAIDVTPSGGTFTLSFNTNLVANGPANIAVIVFSCPAGNPGGGAYTQSEIDLSLIVNNATSSTTAVRANDFLNSIGVCTHMTQGADNPTNVATSLSYTGIRNIRDDGSTNTATLQKFITVHNSSGAKVSLLSVNGNIAASLSEYEMLVAAGALLAAEGPNEPNNWPVTYNGQTSSTSTSMPVAKFQKDLYAAVKADSKLTSIPVFHSSESGGSEPDNCGLQFLTIPNGAGTLMADGTMYADYANTHNYICGNLSGIVDNTAWQCEDPVLNGPWDGLYKEYGHTWWGSGFNGYTTAQLPSVPRVTTETGWMTQGTNALTEAQQGKLFLNLYLSAYKRGWSYTFIYMLHDDAGQGYWGFVRPDYSYKLSATYLHNMTTILSDNTSSFTPGILNYSIPGEPATVHDLLIQKSNGTFELAVWSEKASGTNSVTVNLGATYSTVKLYDPTIGTSVQQTLSNVSSVPLTLSDHPMVLEISGVATSIANSKNTGDEGIKIYPNPFSSNCNIMISNEIVLKNTLIKIYDVCGKEVKKISINNHETIIDKGELQNGIYFYNIINNDENIAKGKLLIQ